jgi:hypothetical protein
MPRNLARRASYAPQQRARWTRGDRGEPVDSAIRRNYPNGSLQEPIFWVGSDQAYTPEWGIYGGQAWTGAQPGMSHSTLNSTGILPAVTRATSLVVGPIIRTHWRYFRRLADSMPEDMSAKDEELPEPLWVSDPQLIGRIPGGDLGRPTIPRPRRLGGNSFWKTLVTHALWWGTGAVLCAEDYEGRPLAGTMRVVSPDRWGYTDDGRYRLLGEDGGEPLESDYDGGFNVGGIRWVMRTIHNFPPSDGSVAGGALSRSGLILSTGTKMNSYLNSILSSGVPTGVLKVSTQNYTEPQAQALKQQWMEAHGGSKKSIAVLASGIDFSPLQLNAVDSDVIHAKGAWLVDLAHAFNISAGMLDAATGSSNNITYASISDRRRDHLDHSLADLGRSVEDLITSMLPWGQRMQIDWLNYTQTDPNQSLPYVESGLKYKWLTVSEIRERMRVSPTTNPLLEETPEPPSGGQ